MAGALPHAVHVVGYLKLNEQEQMEMEIIDNETWNYTKSLYRTFLPRWTIGNGATGFDGRWREGAGSRLLLSPTDMHIHNHIYMLNQFYCGLNSVVVTFALLPCF